MTPPSPLGVARPEVMCLVYLLQLLYFFLSQVYDGEILLYTMLRDTLRQDSDIWAVCLQRHEDVRGRDVVLLCELRHRRVRQQRRVVGAERGVGGDDDALRAAELDDVGLGARAVWRGMSGGASLNLG